MHELSICRSIVGIVEEHAARRQVRSVHLDIGQLRQVVPETLIFSWEIAVNATPLEGAELEVNYIAGSFDCIACGRTTQIDVPYFRCECGSADIEVTAGRELLVTSLDVAGPEPIGG